MTILDEPPAVPAGWTCPRCGKDIHADRAVFHLGRCPETRPAAGHDPLLRPLDELQAQLAAYEALHPSLARYR